jgi:AraC-like DNA-binding protein
MLDDDLAHLRAQLVRCDPAWPVDVSRIVAVVGEHLFDEELTAGWAMERAAAGGSGVRARFRKYVGLTIGRFITRQRLLAAAWLLEHRDAEITGIAFGLGFNHYETFRRAFVRHFGMSPRGYRAVFWGISVE